MAGKKGWMLIICVGLLVSICFGGFTQVIQAKKKEVYVMNVFVSGVPYWIETREAVKSFAKAYGVETRYGGPLDSDPSKQIADIYTLIAEEVDGIVLCASDAVALNSVINKAIDAGIPVITYEGDAPGSKRLSYVCYASDEATEDAAEHVAKLIGYKGKVVISVGAPGQHLTETKLRGYKKGIEKYPGIELVAVIEDKFDGHVGARELKPLLVKHPDIKAILGDNSRSGVGAIMALRELGYKLGQVVVAAYDIDEDTLNLIKEGWIESSIVSNSYFAATLCFQLLYAYNHDCLYPTTMPWKKYGVRPLPEVIKIPTLRVTEENVDAFYRTK